MKKVPPRKSAQSTTVQHETLRKGNSIGVAHAKKLEALKKQKNSSTSSRPSSGVTGTSKRNADAALLNQDHSNSSDSEDGSSINKHQPKDRAYGKKARIDSHGSNYNNGLESSSDDHSSSDNSSKDNKCSPPSPQVASRTNSMQRQEQEVPPAGSNREGLETTDMLAHETQDSVGYIKELTIQGRVATLQENKNLIRGVLPALFGVCKFLQSNNDLLFNGTISRYFIKHLNIGQDRRESWWLECKTLVRKAIDGKRASIGMAIRKEFISESCVDAYKVFVSFVAASNNTCCLFFQN